MKPLPLRHSCGYAVAGVVLLTTQAAIAQDQRSTQLEEIVVTAQKRAASLQDTPISLAAFGSDQLERFGIEDLGDMTAHVPNVDITPFPNSRSSLVIFMRGVGNNDSQSTQDPAVGVYLDGVYIGRSVGLTSDIADLERIEVLRGPQGTLYGRNTTGGAINMITAKPGEEQQTRITLGGGNEGQQSLRALFDSGRMGPVSARLSYYTSEQDGWVNNINGDNDFSAEDKEAARLALRWDISDTFSIDYAYDQSEIVGPQAFYQVLNINEEAADNSAAAQQALEDLINSGNAGPGDAEALAGTAFVNTVLIPQFRERASESRLDNGEWSIPVRDSETDISGHSITASWDSPLGTLKYIGAYRELDEEIFIDYGAGVEDWFDVHVEIDHEQTSHELQWLGDINANMNFVAGLYYFEEDGFEHEDDRAGGAEVENRDIISHNEAIAVYGQLNWQTTEALELILGARYTEDKREAFKDSINFENGPQSGSDSWSNFNPGVTANYQWTDADDAYQLSSYAKIVTGYKSGGYNVRSTEEGFQPPFDEEQMISYELGWKSTFWNQRLRFNGAIFRAEYDDMQIQQIINNQQIFLTDVFNAGQAEINGFEFDVSVVPLTGLSINIAYGYTNAEFIEVIDNSPNSPTFGQDVADTYTMPYAPEHTWNVGIDYEFAPLSFGILRASLNYNWRDERFGTASNPDMEGFKLEDYGLLDARLSLSEVTLGESEWQLALWGKNLLDEEYLVHKISQNFFRSGYFGEPRTVGLELSMRL